MGIEELVWHSIVYLSIVFVIIYVIFGSWIKVLLVNLKRDNIHSADKRVLPVLISHILFSIIFIHPLIIYLLCCLIPNSVWLLFICGYFTILPTAFNLFFLRVLPRFKILRWLSWTPPLKRVIVFNLIIAFLSFQAGGLVVWFLFGEELRHYYP
jgi:hypothetical protein